MSKKDKNYANFGSKFKKINTDLNINKKSVYFSHKDFEIKGNEIIQAKDTVSYHFTSQKINGNLYIKADEIDFSYANLNVTGHIFLDANVIYFDHSLIHGYSGYQYEHFHLAPGTKVYSWDFPHNDFGNLYYYDFDTPTSEWLELAMNY